MMLLNGGFVHFYFILLDLRQTEKLNLRFLFKFSMSNK